MPATYVKDLTAILKAKGAQAYAAACAHPMLVLLGLARTLGSGGGGDATMVAGPDAEELAISSLVGRVFFLCKEDARAKGPVVLGRAGEADVRIPEYSISKRHCEFQLQGATITVRDLGSTNGTSVSGTNIGAAATALSGGETLVIGRFALRFETPTTLLARLR